MTDSSERGLSTQVLDDSSPVEMRSIDIIVVSGVDQGLRARIPQFGLRVGTAPSNHLRLTDPTVSRIHCELQLRRNGVRLLDSGSTNGTYLEAARVHDAELPPGATFRVGATHLRLAAADEPTMVPISARTRFGEMVGVSIEMRRVYAIIERVAPTDTTVLVHGETGTGKELVARAIHDSSKRSAGPFVAVDCGAIAPTLVESEFFGHVRGAFSSAVSDRRGLFEEADGGTLFLDEVGELPLAMQAKLLRALEAREVRRVGSNAVRRVDVRVVAATNRSLAQAVNEGSFREELYYRLAVVEIRLPPLHGRRGDIPMLAQHFYSRLTRSDEPIPRELVATLLTRSWPGNVRELRNYIERWVSLGGDQPEPQPAPPQVAGLVPGLEALIPVELPMREARVAWMHQFQTAYVSALLAKTEGNVTRAARAAGVSRRFLQRLIVKIGMRTADTGEAFEDDSADEPADDIADDHDK